MIYNLICVIIRSSSYYNKSLFEVLSPKGSGLRLISIGELTSRLGSRMMLKIVRYRHSFAEGLKWGLYDNNCSKISTSTRCDFLKISDKLVKSSGFCDFMLSCSFLAYLLKMKLVFCLDWRPSFWLIILSWSVCSININSLSLFKACLAHGDRG